MKKILIPIALVLMLASCTSGKYTTIKTESSSIDRCKISILTSVCKFDSCEGYDPFPKPATIIECNGGVVKSTSSTHLEGKTDVTDTVFLK